MNHELQCLYNADQQDRLDAGGSALDEAVGQRDRERRQRVREILDAGEVREGIDFFNAALIFQHGETLDDYWQAHELARRAADLGHRPGRQLAAAAYDRWLMGQGKPQKYGTQFMPHDGQWKPWPIDPVTTDDERAAWDVPSPTEAARQISESFGASPPLTRETLRRGSEMRSTSSMPWTGECAPNLSGRGRGCQIRSYQQRG